MPHCWNILKRVSPYFSHLFLASRSTAILMKVASALFSLMQGYVLLISFDSMHFQCVLQSLVLIVTQMPQQAVNLWGFGVASCQRIIQRAGVVMMQGFETHKSNDPYLNENGWMESAQAIYQKTSTMATKSSTLSFHPLSLLMNLTKYPKYTSLSSNTSVWPCATNTSSMPYPFQATSTRINISFTLYYSIRMLQNKHMWKKWLKATPLNQVARLMVQAPMSTKLPNFTVRQGIRPVVLRRNRSTRRRSCEVRGIYTKLVNGWKCSNVFKCSYQTCETNTVPGSL